MKSEVKKLKKSQVEITIEVSADELRPYLIKAAEKISKEVKIEGFRLGKASYDIVKQKVGEMAIMQEAIDDVITKTYYEVLDEHKIVTIGQPKIDIEKLAPGNDFVYKAIADILPEVKIGDWKKIKIKRDKVVVTDEQLQHVLTDIQKMRASEKLVERTAQTGDKLIIDFEVYIDKVLLENGAQKNYPIVIGENRFIPGFEEQLIGLKAGEEKTFELKFPDKYFEAKLAGKQAEFKVKCQNVFEVDLPKLDDVFAKDISAKKFETLEELKKSIVENIEAEEKHKQEHRLEIELLDKVVDICQFEEIPEALLDYEISKMMNELEDSIIKQGFNFEDYLTSLKKTADEMKVEFKPQAEKRVKTSILSREIYHQQKIEVTPDQIDAEIEEMMQNYPANPEVRKQLESETYRDYLKNIIGNRQVLELLKREIIVEN